ncbi:hypothetical protein BY996DRAFT_7978879 [Phakopsora pachyrhizi]|uniref:Expressed protein n=1 Tax=Phakopsora pachyrhizi TaxID=170000 RepID=A0AAV0B789_PHAPC|nr:hypothetical protein BY996DRAFT_7978879 [Phakopsora pachyrhizi]CAH7681482.1 expressed protein [Phakopsora pachyrhizi]
MEKDYEDLKSCIQKTKKQNWQTRQFEDLKKIETTLAEMIILIRVKIYEKFSPDNVSPYIEGLDKDLSRIVFERIIHNCFKNLFEVLNSDKNILKPGSSIEDVPLIPLVYKLFEYMEKFGLQENRLEKNKSLIKIFLSEEKPLKQLIWYICTVLIKERGFIGVFLTSDLKEYIRNHNDLDHIRFLLNSLDTEHWKEIELGFLEAHGILDYNGSVFHESFVKNNRRFSEYEKFIRKNELMLKNIQDIENTLPNMYKIDLTYPNRHIRGNRYALGNGILLANFIKCTFAYHVQNYLKRYQKNIKIENVEQHKIEIFGAFFKVFQNILKVITAFEDKFNFGTNTRKKISRTEFLLKLLNLMPSPDFYKDWVSGHPKKIFIKNSNSEYFLKYRHVELKKSKNSNISTILRTMKNEYDELTRQIIRSVDNGSKFDKSAIDCWYRIINIYIEFLHSILQDISEVEGGLEYLGLSKTEIHSFFKEL